jgi:hypothetical protein
LFETDEKILVAPVAATNEGSAIIQMQMNSNNPFVAALQLQQQQQNQQWNNNNNNINLYKNRITNNESYMNKLNNNNNYQQPSEQQFGVGGGGKSERNVFNWIKNVINENPVDIMDASCGRRPIRYTRIMNGRESVPNSWPWAISISLEGPKEIVPHACGGTLISKRYVITAAHCVLKSSIYSLVGKPTPNQPKFNSAERMMRVNVGVHDRTNDIVPSNVYGVESVRMVCSYLFN